VKYRMRRVGILKILDGMVLSNWFLPKSAKSNFVHRSNASRIVPWNWLLLTRNIPEKWYSDREKDVRRCYHRTEAGRNSKKILTKIAQVRQ
jgi:hypothetical protein